MVVRGSGAVRHIRWVVVAGVVVAGGSYIVLSVLGFTSLAGIVTQCVFWFLLLYVVVRILYVVVSAKRRPAARTAAQASDAELNALLLGKRSPTMLDKPVDQYSTYPSEGRGADDTRPRGAPGQP